MAFENVFARAIRSLYLVNEPLARCLYIRKIRFIAYPLSVKLKAFPSANLVMDTKLN